MSIFLHQYPHIYTHITLFTIYYIILFNFKKNIYIDFLPFTRNSYTRDSSVFSLIFSHILSHDLLRFEDSGWRREGGGGGGGGGGRREKWGEVEVKECHGGRGAVGRMGVRRW